MRLSGRTALVTGGASGFGAGIAQRFVAEGARVLIADIDAEALDLCRGRHRAFLATIPLGPFSAPADLAAAAVYLYADEASMVTGVAPEIDGGRCI